MFNTKQIIITVSVVAIVTSLFGCSVLNPIVGKWENTGSLGNYCFPSLEFFINGTVKAGEATGTYKKIGDDKIKIDMEIGAAGGFIPGREYEYKIEDNTLSFSGAQFYCEYVSTDKPAKPPQRSKEQTELLESVAGDGKIIFSSMRQPEGLYIMNPDGTDLQALNFHGLSIDCSPDGKKVVASNVNFEKIFIINIDGTNKVDLLDVGSNGDVAGPSWSPDGKQIAYSQGTTEGVNTYFEIYVMNVDGSDQTQLTNTTKKNQVTNTGPVWTPDGRIAFEESNFEGQRKYYIMNSDGKNVSEISEDTYDSYVIEWSPDKMAYVREVDGPFDIALFNADATVSVRLLDDKISDFTPTWCP